MRSSRQGVQIDWYSVALAAICTSILVFIAAPLVIVVVNSFNSAPYSSFPPEGFSLRWYRQVFERPEFARGFQNSVIVGVVSSLIAVWAAVLAAVALVRHRFFGADLVRSFLLSPIVIPKIVLGLSLYILYLRWGIFGSLTSLIIAHVVITMPFALAVMASSVASLNPVLEEAAQDLGARDWQVILYIMLPQMKVGLAVSTIFAFIISFDQIDTTLFLVRPANNTLPIEMFLYMERWQDPSMAALSTLLILFSIAVLFVFKSVVGSITGYWTR